MKLIFTGLLLVVSYFCSGQQLVYTPINPAFGGDTFNYQWMLSSANAQNSFEDQNGMFGDEESDLDQFAENLNRQLLSQLSRSLLDEQLGGGLEEGTFNFGNLALEVYDTSEGLVVNILDTNTGEQTQVVVPN